MQELADYWNVDVSKIPSWSDPIHIMSMLQMMEAGTIKMMWVNGTNPAVSLPKLGRIRDILTDPGLFVGVTLAASVDNGPCSCFCCRLSPKTSLKPRQLNWPMLSCPLPCGEKRRVSLLMSTGEAKGLSEQLCLRLS